MSQEGLTVAAVATARAKAAISLIRLSGDDCFKIISACFSADINKKPYRTAILGKITDKEGSLIDECIVTLYKAPFSYTGEDMAEICCHGGILITNKVLSRLLECGAVTAGAGEFSKRAFLNGKMDLTKAGGIIDVINAETELELKAATGAANGRIRRAIDDICDVLYDQTAKFLVAVDYPDEVFEDLSETELLSALSQCREGISRLVDSYRIGSVIKEGIPTAIVGRANSGKSSLMNLLSKRDKSIVTEVEGTTRDVIENTVSVCGVKLLLSDTAGLRQSDDEVERIGIEKSLSVLSGSSLCLAVFDRSKPLDAEDLRLCDLCKGKTAIAVINKCDLPQKADTEPILNSFKHTVYISAKTGAGEKELSEIIEKLYLSEDIDLSQEAVITDLAQKDSLLKADSLLALSEESLKCGATFDAVFSDIEKALSVLGGITGRAVSEQIVNTIFSKFCVGK